ncbi:MAG: PQQ-binding-like beta-propeller repeat protein [Gemmobacter sp.]|uniref:outer membrane protein assembly factor BamB family protein n=1 Tax=Gemmobacter sp. TaxID=1898957 RepID=UPI00391907A6
MSKFVGLVGALALASVVAGCERKLILPGQRFDTRTPLEQTLPAAEGARVPDPAVPQNRSLPVALGPAVANADWTHRAGSPSRAMPHLALGAAPQRLWSAPIGTGSSRRARLSVAPVVAGGSVFAMDARNRLTALSAATGGALWSFDVTPAGESPEAASGGGLAVGDGKLFVTTGFGELIALNPATGAVLWRQRFDGPVSGAPAVVGGTVYVAGRDAAAWAVNAADGKIRWVQSGVRQSAGLLGGSAPAVADKVVVMPFASGQVAALDRAKGDMAWMGAVAGQRAGRAAAFVADLTGDPVVSGGRVYVGSAAGRTAAFRLDTGEMLWEAREGAMGPVWPVGNAVFTVTDDGRLVRLDAATGETVWATPLGHFTNDRPRRQLGVVAHYGPVLAGGRLVVASSDGLVRFVAPDSGAVLGVIEMGPGGGAAAAPAVAGGTLYVVTTGGQVQAFR